MSDNKNLHGQETILSPQSQNDVNPSDECPSLGTSAYDAFIKRQSRQSRIDATNAHPLLRVVSTIVIMILGGGFLWNAYSSLQNRPLWMGILSGLVFGGYAIVVLSYLRHSWGKSGR